MYDKTCISAGADLRTLLLSVPEIAASVTDVYPIIGDEAALPYIVYRCAGMSETALKDRLSPDRANFEVVVYAADYDEGAALAEAVRGVLCDAHCGQIHGGRVINYSNGYAGDCFYHLLTASLRINPLNFR